MNSEPAVVLAALALVIAASPLRAQQRSDPLAWVAALRSDDWRERNAAARALDELPAERLPIAALVEFVDGEGGELPYVEAPQWWGLGGGLGGSRKTRDPLDRLLDRPGIWLGPSIVFGPGLDTALAPSVLASLDAPLSSRPLAIYVLRRAADPEVTRRLKRWLHAEDRQVARQAAYSLACHGTAGRIVLVEELRARGVERYALEALLHADGAEGQIEGWLRAVSDGALRLALRLAASESAAVGGKVARLLLASRDEDVGRTAIRILLREKEAALPFLGDALRGDDVVAQRRALAAVARLGPVALPLVEVVIPLLGSDDAGVGLWAPQALAMMQPQGEVAAEVEGAMLAVLATDLPRRQRLALLESLAACVPAGEASLATLEQAARDGNRLERRVALDSLLSLGGEERLGAELEERLEERYAVINLAYRASGTGAVLRVGLKKFSLTQLEAAIRWIPEDAFVWTAWADNALGARAAPYDLQVVDRLVAWLHHEDPRLDHMASFAQIDVARRGLRSLPKGFLDPEVHSSERVAMRLIALVSGEHLSDALLAEAMAVLPAMGASVWEHYASACGRNPTFAALFLAALRGSDDALAAELADRADRLRGDFDDGFVIGLLEDSDPRIRGVGRELASAIRPPPARLIEMIGSDLEAGDVERQRGSLRALLFGVSFERGAVPPTLRRAVEDLLREPELREDALHVLLSWCER